GRELAVPVLQAAEGLYRSPEDPWPVLQRVVADQVLDRHIARPEHSVPLRAIGHDGPAVRKARTDVPERVHCEGVGAGVPGLVELLVVGEEVAAVSAGARMQMLGPDADIVDRGGAR